MADRHGFWSLFSLGKLKALTVTATAKPTVEAGAEVSAVTLKPVVESIAPGLSALSSSLGNIVLFGGFGVVSAISNQIEYQHERDKIGNFYREEIAAKTHKAQNKITDSDLSMMENGNRKQGVKANKVIGDAIDKERIIRNVGIAASFIATVAVYALVHSIVHIPLEFSLPFAAKVAVSVLSYVAIKKPLVKAGEALLGADKDGAHDLIQNIAKDRELGKAVTREQVVEVFIAGNKQISHFVDEKYGRHYHDLALADKVRVASELAQVMPIDKIVHGINLGSSNASELAFTVQGDMSGVLPKSPERTEPPTAWQSFKSQCRKIARSVGGMFSAEKAHPIEAIAAINKAHKEAVVPEPLPESPVVELNNQAGFVERLGRGPKGEAVSHAQELAARRAEQVVMPGSPTIQ